MKYYLPKLLVIWNTAEVLLPYYRNLLRENLLHLPAVLYSSAIGFIPHLPKANSRL